MKIRSKPGLSWSWEQLELFWRQDHCYRLSTSGEDCLYTLLAWTHSYTLPLTTVHRSQSLADFLFQTAHLPRWTSSKSPQSFWTCTNAPIVPERQILCNRECLLSCAGKARVYIEQSHLYPQAQILRSHSHADLSHLQCIHAVDDSTACLDCVWLSEDLFSLSLLRTWQCILPFIHD